MWADFKFPPINLHNVWQSKYMRELEGDGMEIIERKKKGKETCFGCKHLEVKDIWRGMHTASCGLTDGLITPHEWTGDKVIITGVGDFCKGKEVDHVSDQ